MVACDVILLIASSVALRQWQPARDHDGRSPRAVLRGGGGPARGSVWCVVCGPALGSVCAALRAPGVGGLCRCARLMGPCLRARAALEG